MSKSEMTRGKFLVFAIGFIIMFGVKLLPPPWGMSSAAFQVFGVVIGGLIMLFVTVGLSSVMIFLALSLIPELGVGTVAAQSFGNSTFMLMMFIFMFSSVLDKRGIAKRIAIGLMTSRIGRKGPWYTVTMIFVAAFIIGSFLGSALSLMIFLPILVQIFRETGSGSPEQKSPITSLLVCGVAICVCIAQCGTPIGHTITIYGMRAYEQYTGGSLDFGTYCAISLPVAILTVIAWCLIARFIWKPDLSAMSGLDYDRLRAEVTAMNRGDKIATAIYVLVILAWVIPGVSRYLIPSLYNAVFSKIDDNIPAMIGISALCLIRSEGKPLITYDELIKTVPFKTILYMAAVLGLSGCVNNADVGLSAWLAEVLGDAFSGMGVVTFVIVIVTICILATNFMPNMVVVTLGMAVAMPLMTGIYDGQFSPMVVGALITAAGSYAYAAPSACPTAAIACGSGWIDYADLLKFGLISAVTAIIFSCAVGIPLGFIM